MLTLNRSNSYFFINGEISPDIVESLDRVLSYYVQNYEKTDAFQSGKWDGREHLFRRSKNGSYYFPFGLIDTVVQTLSIWDIPFEVKESRNARIEEMNDPDGFSLREYQREAIYKLIHNCYNSSGVIALPTAAGKCHGKGTKILMYDGSIKNVEDVKVGDQLMGPDSKPRNVLSLARGVDEMFLISPIKGDSWTCNKSHVLSLKATQEGKGVNRGIINIPLNEYLNKSKTFKHVMKQWRTGIDFECHETYIDPYILGLWLGDGTKKYPQITNSDPEIIKELETFADLNNLNILRVPGNNTTMHNFSSPIRGYPGMNKLRNAMKHCVINNEKRIPREYLINSEYNRLQLLSGLLDSDGYYHHCGYEIITKYDGLKDDILFLARSLGFAAYSVIKIGRIKSTGFEGKYYRITINGITDRIPCKVERKKALKRKMKKDVLKMGFKVIPQGIGEYYGFELDGDHLYLLGDFTVTHNTRCALWWAKKLNRPFIVIVHRKELMYQWRDAILDAGFTDYGLIGDGINDTFKHFVTIGMVQTLNNMDLTGVETGLLIIDECFPYDTIVKTDVGNLKIGYIVENKIKCNVLTHTGEYKPITNWYKKPLQSKMVKCIHETGWFECTENHKILTNRGWIKAIDLSCRDYIYYTDDLQMQDMREGVQNPRSAWRACKCSSFTPGIAIKKIKNSMGEIVRFRKARPDDKNPENAQCMVRQNRIDGNTTSIDIRKFNGGYVNYIPEFIQSCPEVCNSAFFKAIPIRRLEIYDNEKLVWNTSKTRGKQRLWNDELCIHNTFSSMFKRGVRYCKSGWKNTIYREMAIRNKRSYSNRSVVFGRWLQNAKKRCCDIFRKDNSGRGRFIKKLAIEQMGYSIKCISLYQRIKNWYISTKIYKHIHSNIARFFIYPSHNAIQNSVYDIEVADNHSYTANGVVVHNCHTIPSKTAYSVCMKIKADYRLGLSATPTRSDGAEMKIFACCGTIAASISVEQLVEGGYLAAPIFRIENLSPARLKYNESWQNVYKQGIVLNFERNEKISQIAEEYLSKGRQVYVHVNQIDHGKCLTGMIDGAVFVCGSTNKKERADIIDRFKSGEIRCLVSTLLKEGVSIDGISCLIYAAGGKSEVATIQTIGRALRMDEKFGDAIIIDFIERGHRILENHVQERINAYRETYGDLFQY